ncbi:MAG: hypothetical protein AAF389_05765 [Gemmatimonadota bacterium]
MDHPVATTRALGVRASRSTSTLVAALALSTLVGCAAGEPEESGLEEQLAILFEGTDDYCSIDGISAEVLAQAPREGGAPVDDVNWFARPVLHDGDDFIIAFASHDQNYLYNLSTDSRVKIPDRSDAVATPDGRYMTVPSYYTPDSNTRFYDVQPMLDALAAGRDVDTMEPVFIHEHPAMSRVYYQSTALLSEVDTDSGLETTYRLMFSGTADESRFRIVDYLFRHHADSGELLAVEPSAPMVICPAVENDLNTPFISKDGRYVAAYTSPEAGNSWTAGASLKVFEITGTDASAGTTTCREVADVGFAAGKADFSFDNRQLTFHLSQGAYLTPFVNGGLPEGTITDVMVARFAFDDAGGISGVESVQRLTTSTASGVGSYFPAYFPDGNLFFLANEIPRDADGEKRFHFYTVDPSSRGWRTPSTSDPAMLDQWTELGELWQAACTDPPFDQEPFPLDEHELAAHVMALTVPQCEALVFDARASDETSMRAWDTLSGLCRGLESS